MSRREFTGSDITSRKVPLLADGTLSIPWYRQVAAAAWWALLLAGLGWMFESYDSFMLSLTLPTLAQEFSLSKADIGGLISITAAGQILGGIVFGWVSDRLGRVRTALLCVTVYSLFSGLIAFAPSASWLAGLRFCGALGMGGTWTAGAALVAESWGPQFRGRGGAFMQMGLPVGAILAIAAAAVIGALNGGLAHHGWRILYLIGALPAVLLFFVARKTPESPVWLARHQETGVAQQTAPGPRPALPPGTLRNAMLAFAFVFFLQYVFWGVFTWTPTFLATVKHFNFLHSLPFVLALQLGAMTGFLVFGAFVDRLGRRPMFIGYILIGIVAVSGYAYGPAAWLILAIFFTGFAVNGIFAGMGPFTAELLPDTPSRGFIMGLIYNGGRIGGFIAPSVIGLLASGAGGFETGLGTTVAAFVCALLVILCAPETKGRTLR